MIIASLEQNTNLIGQLTLAMFRRHAAEGGFDDRFVGHMDFALWCRLLAHGDFAYLAEPLATWRVHETQQTAKHQKTDASDRERLQLTEINFAQPWLQKAITHRALFTQIYYLRKQYGADADPLVRTLRSQLPPGRYACQWLRHRTLRPFQKLRRRLSRD